MLKATPSWCRHIYIIIWYDVCALEQFSEECLQLVMSTKFSMIRLLESHRWSKWRTVCSVTDTPIKRLKDIKSVILNKPIGQQCFRTDVWHLCKGPFYGLGIRCQRIFVRKQNFSHKIGITKAVSQKNPHLLQQYYCDNIWPAWIGNSFVAAKRRFGFGKLRNALTNCST